MRIALFSGNYNYLREGANQALNTLVRYLEAKADCRVRVYSPVTDTPAFEPAGTLVPVPSIALPVRGEFRLALRLPRSIRRDIGPARGAAAHDAGDLRDAERRHVGLVEEDPPEVLAVGEDFGLIGQVRPAAVDQIDAGQAVFLRDFLRADAS